MRNYFVDDISKVLTATKKKLSETLLLLLAASLFSLRIRQLRASLEEHYNIKFAGFLQVFGIPQLLFPSTSVDIRFYDLTAIQAQKVLQNDQASERQTFL